MKTLCSFIQTEEAAWIQSSCHDSTSRLSTSAFDYNPQTCMSVCSHMIYLSHQLLFSYLQYCIHGYDFGLAGLVFLFMRLYKVVVQTV